MWCVVCIAMCIAMRRAACTTHQGQCALVVRFGSHQCTATEDPTQRRYYWRPIVHPACSPPPAIEHPPSDRNQMHTKTIPTPRFTHMFKRCNDAVRMASTLELRSDADTHCTDDAKPETSAAVDTGTHPLQLPWRFPDQICWQAMCGQEALEVRSDGSEGACRPT